ncbi:hypothetical protein AeRB84_013262 [Aphanomyces euteiches]|nr:hypothetical protein AeRB84_013262 [Aphanomyces euteiches]
MTSKEWEHWKAAIEMELASIKSNGTWKYVKPPQDRKTLKTTWVFRVKEKCDGSIERFKARLVVKGFLQVKGLDYDEVFAPVMRLESLRTLLAIGNALDLPIDQMDIDTAFLNGTLEEEIYLDLPEGLQMKDVIKDANWVGASELTSSPSQVSCLLIKALYGLKQAPREWHKVLTTFLGGVGFEKTNVESCIYVRRLKSQIAIVAIYVDDLVVVAENDNVMAEVKTAIKNRFASKDMGPINYILGIRVERDREKRIMHISQPLNAKNMLMRFDLDQARPATTPLDKVLDGSDCPSDGHVRTEAERLNHANFRQCIGSLMYLMLGTRPDLAYAVQALSRYLNNPGKSHIGKMKQVMRYVAGTIDYGLVYRGTDLNLQDYTDSDYAANPDTRRSVSGYCTYVGDCLVSWSSQCQPAKEVLFMRTLNSELGNPITTGIILHADNQPAIATATNPVHHSRTKHIDVRYHFVRERIQLQELGLEYVPSKDNVADLFTKPLPAAVFLPLRDKLGLAKPPLVSGAPLSNCAWNMAYDLATRENSPLRSTCSHDDEAMWASIFSVLNDPSEKDDIPPKAKQRRHNKTRSEIGALEWRRKGLEAQLESMKQSHANHRSSVSSWKSAATRERLERIKSVELNKLLQIAISERRDYITRLNRIVYRASRLSVPPEVLPPFEVPNKKSKNLPGAGRHEALPDPQALVDYITERRSRERAVTSIHVINFMKRTQRAWLNSYVATHDTDKAYNNLMRMIQRFCDRHGFSKQKPHKMKRNQEELEELRDEFAEDFHRRYAAYGSNDVYNVDETAVYFDMPHERYGLFAAAIRPCLRVKSTLCE